VAGEGELRGAANAAATAKFNATKQMTRMMKRSSLILISSAF
jgi:hypothetical protein